MFDGIYKLLRRLGRGRPTSIQARYPQYRIGKGSYSTDLQVYSWNEGATLRIGAFCAIGHGVKVYLGGEHRVDWVTTYPFSMLWDQAKHISGHPRTKGDVDIGNDVWIGRDAVILSGVTIGDGAVIGASAVVAKDIEPYFIVAGNPARPIRRRFDDETVQRLLRVRWWEWDDRRIENALPMLLRSDIQAFLQAAETNEN